MAAAREWTKAEKWFPKPSELVQLAAEIGAKQQRSGLRALPSPVETEPLQVRIAQKLRIVETFDRMGIRNKHVHKQIIALNAEAAESSMPGIDVAKLPAWLQERVGAA